MKKSTCFNLWRNKQAYAYFRHMLFFHTEQIIQIMELELVTVNDL